jgi:hypothetical protein
MFKFFPLWIKGHIESDLNSSLDMATYEIKLKNLLDEQGLNQYKQIPNGIEFVGGLYSFPQKNRNAIAHGARTRLLFSQKDTKIRLNYEISMWNTLIWGVILFGLAAYFVGPQLVDAFEIENSKRFWGPVSILTCLIGVTSLMYSLPVSAVRDLCRKTLKP